MRLIDLSQPIFHDSPNCPAHPPVKSEILKDHPECGWRVELLTLASHTGSHVDAPLHKIAGGASVGILVLRARIAAWSTRNDPTSRDVRHYLLLACAVA